MPERGVGALPICGREHDQFQLPLEIFSPRHSGKVGGQHVRRLHVQVLNLRRVVQRRIFIQLDVRRLQCIMIKLHDNTNLVLQSQLGALRQDAHDGVLIPYEPLTYPL